MPFTSFRIITVDIIVFAKNHSPIKMARFLKMKRDIDECNHEREQTSNVESCSSKKAKVRPSRKYNESYLSIGFLGPDFYQRRTCADIKKALAIFHLISM